MARPTTRSRTTGVTSPTIDGVPPSTQTLIPSTINTIQDESEELQALRHENERLRKELAGNSRLTRGTTPNEARAPLAQSSSPATTDPSSESSGNVAQPPPKRQATATHKRMASKELPHRSKRQRDGKFAEPSKYYGKTVKEHQLFRTKLEAVFKVAPNQFATDGAKIYYAATLCDGRALEHWHTLSEQIDMNKITFEKFSSKMLDRIQTASHRAQEAETKYVDARQLPGQNVQDFASYYSSLINNLLEPPSDEAKMRNFIPRLNKPIKTQLAASNSTFRSFDDVVSAASRVEEALQLQRTPANNVYAPRQITRTSFRRDRYPRGETQVRTMRFGHERPAGGRPPTCYNCDEIGHLRRDCPKARSGPNNTPLGQGNA